MKAANFRKFIYNRLLSIRDNVVLRKCCMDILIRNNIRDGEITSYEFVNGYPAIVLEDGATLVSYKNENMPINTNWRIPATHVGTLLSYILRYKYPHCLPNKIINTGIIPRRLFPSLLHRQHINTLSELQKDDQERFLKMLAINPGDRVLELGPFIGFGTVRMSELVGEKGQIVSVEADERAYAILSLNIEKNKKQNVTCLNYAASSTDSDNVQFYMGEKQANSLLSEITSKNHVKEIKSRTIESIINEANFEPNFILLTINGAELQALSSSQNFLTKAKALRIIAPGWYNDGEGKIGHRIVKLLIALGFEVARTPGMHIFAYKPS